MGKSESIGFVDGSMVVVAMGACVAGLVAGLAEREREVEGRSGATKCGRCDGSGKVPCMCTRWSYASVSGGEGKEKLRRGCQSCAGNLRVPCPYCGGGGLMSPVLRPQARPARVEEPGSGDENWCRWNRK